MTNKNEILLNDIVVSDDTKRADAYIATLTGKTRSRISSSIDNGLLIVNGKIAKKSDKLKKGDIISFSLMAEELPNLTPQNIPFDIILDRPDYAIIDKPAGLTVHPAAGNFDKTLVNALLYAFKIDDEDNGFRPGIVHRIDKDTSGLLIIAKNTEARYKLSELFLKRQVDKEYTAVACGVPRFKEKTVDAPLARDKYNRLRMSVSEEGKNAKSIFYAEEIYTNAFLARVKILTGRTHQIRVHASYIKHPLVGDTLYGGKPLYGFSRQALHSSKLSFTDPFTNELIEASSQIPNDMLELISAIKNNAR